MGRSKIFIALLWMAVGALAGAAETRTLVLDDGQVVRLETGKVDVPESRERPTSRTISISYYRLSSTASRPSAPIFLLAGGPGDSWVDRFETRDGREEALFYRQIGDVVLFDQRGAGHSRPRLVCPETIGLPLDEVVTEQSYAVAVRRAARKCRAHWEREGVDLKAYNTLENAADVDELRRVLGYRQISLVGGSYGSHLALALIRRYPESIARIVLYGVEGPDHTYDLPSAVLQAYERIAAAAERSEAFKGRIPEGGLIEGLRQVERRLDAQPAVVEVARHGEPVRVTVGRFDVQRSIPSGALNLDNLGWAARAVQIIEGDYSRVANDAIDTREQRLDAMYFMMDCASGISRERLARLQDDAAEHAAQDVLGDLNSDYLAACNEWEARDLGAEFRDDVVSAMPALIFSGTWDIATPLRNGAEVARALSRSRLVTVEGGTHLTLKDLLKLWNPMRSLMSDFLRGREITPPALITLPSAAFKAPAAR